MEGRRLETATATSMGTVAAEGQGANLVDLKGDQAASGLDSDLALAGKWKRVEHGAEQGAGDEERSKLADDMPADSGDGAASSRTNGTGHGRSEGRPYDQLLAERKALKANQQQAMLTAQAGAAGGAPPMHLRPTKAKNDKDECVIAPTPPLPPHQQHKVDGGIGGGAQLGGAGKMAADDAAGEEKPAHLAHMQGERPCKCPVEGCGKSFSLDYKLRSHLRAIHGLVGRLGWGGKRGCTHLMPYVRAPAALRKALRLRVKASGAHQQRERQAGAHMYEARAGRRDATPAHSAVRCGRAGAGWLAGAVTDADVLLDIRLGEHVAKHGAVTSRLDAVESVLRAAGTALHYTVISEVASRRGLMSSCGSTRLERLQGQERLTSPYCTACQGWRAGSAFHVGKRRRVKCGDRRRPCSCCVDNREAALGSAQGASTGAAAGMRSMAVDGSVGASPHEKRRQDHDARLELSKKQRLENDARLEQEKLRRKVTLVVANSSVLFSDLLSECAQAGILLAGGKPIEMANRMQLAHELTKKWAESDARLEHEKFILFGLDSKSPRAGGGKDIPGRGGGGGGGEDHMARVHPLLPAEDCFDPDPRLDSPRGGPCVVEQAEQSSDHPAAACSTCADADAPAPSENGGKAADELEDDGNEDWLRRFLDVHTIYDDSAIVSLGQGVFGLKRDPCRSESDEAVRRQMMGRDAGGMGEASRAAATETPVANNDESRINRPPFMNNTYDRILPAVEFSGDDAAGRLQKLAGACSKNVAAASAPSPPQRVYAEMDCAKTAAVGALGAGGVGGGPTGFCVDLEQTRGMEAASADARALRLSDGEPLHHDKVHSEMEGSIVDTTRPEQEQATKEECRDKDHRDSPSDLLLKSLMDSADTQASAKEKWQFFEFRSRQDQIEPEATARYDDSDMIVDEERLPERFPSLAQWAKAIKGRAVSVKPCVFFKGKSLRKHEADLEAKKAVLQAATSRTRGQQPSRVEGGKKRKVYNISSQNPPDTASTRGQGAMQCQCQEVSASEIAAEVKAALASGLQQFHHRSDPEEDLQLHDRDMGRIGRMRDAKSAPRKFQKKMPKPGGYPLGAFDCRFSPYTMRSTSTWVALSKADIRFDFERIQTEKSVCSSQMPIKTGALSSAFKCDGHDVSQQDGFKPGAGRKARLQIKAQEPATTRKGAGEIAEADSPDESPFRTRKRKEAGEGFGIFCDLQPQSRAEEKRQLAAAMELSLN